MKNFTLPVIFVFIFQCSSCIMNEKETPRPSKSPSTTEATDRFQKYAGLTIIDAHNHDASGYRYLQKEEMWDTYYIDKIVLFGDISEPSAMVTDSIALQAFKMNKNKYIPFIAGINLHDESCLQYIDSLFNLGVYGIGEIVGASSFSPITSNLPWKALHPLDGYLPEIYEKCAEYNKPILLHLDPPNGSVIDSLEKAADLYPETNFIFGHANAYNSPEAIRTLLEKHSNIYMDFFAGFTAYNKESEYTLQDFVPVINDYPDMFFVSTDSSYDLENVELGYIAMYDLFDLLDFETVKKIAGQNLLDLFE